MSYSPKTCKELDMTERLTFTVRSRWALEEPLILRLTGRSPERILSRMDLDRIMTTCLSSSQQEVQIDKEHRVAAINMAEARRRGDDQPPRIILPEYILAKKCMCQQEGS